MYEWCSDLIISIVMVLASHSFLIYPVGVPMQTLQSDLSTYFGFNFIKLILYLTSTVFLLY